MTPAEFLFAGLRLAAILVSIAIVAHKLRVAYLRVSGSLALLAETVLAVSLLLIAAETLGLFSLDRTVPLISLLVALAALSWLLPGLPPAERRAELGAAPAGVQTARKLTLATLSASTALVVVAGQWCLQSANALGAGMFNFDTLWYHMPFAAQFAQSGGVSAIQFTQADPYVAYYPANSELLHAIGILALHNDFLSPLLNLLWLALALLAAWCVGRPWRVERLTLLAGCLVVSLPVLSVTQPGGAFNDIAGLAMLLAAVALAVNAAGDLTILAVVGLALGLAVGTKVTFIVPAIVLGAGLTLRAPRGRRRAAAALLGASVVLTGGWWYLRDLIDVGNPLGLRMHLGPLLLSGPSSPLATAQQQTVISQVSHLSLWGSRFGPGLEHALGPLWPLVLAVYLAGTAGAIGLARRPPLRVLAITAAVAGISYLFLPTGASAIARESALFEVNLRYVTPAIALGALLLPIVARLRAPWALGGLAPALALLVLLTQLEPALWPTQPSRHLAFLLGVAVVAVLVWRARSLARLLPRVGFAGLGGVLLLALVASAFLVQRHYFDRRYLVGYKADPGLGAIYRWAQGVAHARIALYGAVNQYPLYGARDTNRVSYLGEPTPDGGYRPIAECRRWRAALAAGRYQYVVLTPAPTASVPVAWTKSDPAFRLVLQPGATDFVFKSTGRPSPRLCS
jgi:hypothetical protein